MSRPALKLISHKLCPYVQRARIVLEEKSIPHDIEFIDLANKPQWFLDISPLGKVPVLLVGGEPLFESAVIAEYLDEVTPGSLHPSDPLEKARNRSWIEFASSTLASIGAFYSAADQAAFDNARVTLKQRFLTLEEALGDGPYFNGDELSLVDAAFGPVFRYFDVIEGYADFGFFDDVPKVVAWRTRLRQHSSVQRAAVDDYHERLHQFFLDRGSVLTRIIREERVA
jgi:glutathione S-transferase